MIKYFKDTHNWIQFAMMIIIGVIIAPVAPLFTIQWFIYVIALCVYGVSNYEQGRRDTLEKYK